MSNISSLSTNGNFVTPTTSGRQRAQSAFNLNPNYRTELNERATRVARIKARLVNAAKKPLVNLTTKHPFNTGRPKRNRKNRRTTRRVRKN